MFMGIYGSLKYVHTCVVARLPACAEKQLNQTIINYRSDILYIYSTQMV